MRAAAAVPHWGMTSDLARPLTLLAFIGIAVHALLALTVADLIVGQAGPHETLAGLTYGLVLPSFAALAAAVALLLVVLVARSGSVLRVVGWMALMLGAATAVWGAFFAYLFAGDPALRSVLSTGIGNAVAAAVVCLPLLPFAGRPLMRSPGPDRELSARN